MKTLKIPSFLLIGIIGIQTTFAYDTKGLGAAGTSAAKGAGNAMAGQVVAQSGSAGALSLGVRAGLNLGKIETSNSYSSESETFSNGVSQSKSSRSITSDASYMTGNLIGFQVGAVLDIMITDFFYVQPGLMLSSKGSETEEERESSNQAGSMSNSFYKSKTNMKINPYYIDVPIMLSLKGTLSDNLALRAQAGPYFGFGLFGGAELSRESSNNGIPSTPSPDDKIKVKNIFSPTEEEKEKFEFGGLNRFNFGIGFGAGIEFNGFYLGASYNYGLTNLMKKYEYSDTYGTTTLEKGSKEQDYYERTFSVTLGYNF